MMGEVQKPGNFTWDRDSQLTLLKALAMAGGFSTFASPSGTIIIREEGTGKRIIRANVDRIIRSPQEAQDIHLQPGDVVIVPQSLF